jgi:hypothetical protein
VGLRHFPFRCVGCKLILAEKLLRIWSTYYWLAVGMYSNGAPRLWVTGRGANLQPSGRDLWRSWPCFLPVLVQVISLYRPHTCPCSLDEIWRAQYPGSTYHECANFRQYDSSVRPFIWKIMLLQLICVGHILTLGAFIVFLWVFVHQGPWILVANFYFSLPLNREYFSLFWSHQFFLFYLKNAFRYPSGYAFYQ